MSISSNNCCLLPLSFFKQYINGVQSLHKETSNTDQSIILAHLSSYTTLWLLTYIWVRLEIQTGTITEYEFLMTPNVMSMAHLLNIKWYSSHLPYHQVWQSGNLVLKQDTYHSRRQAWHWNDGHKLKLVLVSVRPSFLVRFVSYRTILLPSKHIKFSTGKKNKSTYFLPGDTCFS